MFSCVHSFICQSAKTFEYMVEMELKLFKVAKKLQFTVQLTRPDGSKMTANSIYFATHNSGTVGYLLSCFPPYFAETHLVIFRLIKMLLLNLLLLNLLRKHNKLLLKFSLQILILPMLI